MIHPKLDRGIVWCKSCGRTEHVNANWMIWNNEGARWPKCCGYTMTIDSPEERSALEVPNASQEKAVAFAEECLQRFGHVVCRYYNTAIGEITTAMWNKYQMPQPFKVIREATEEEWLAFRALYESRYGKIPNEYKYVGGKPYIMVTD